MPSSVSGKPVDSSGSITPAADGSSAHAGPATRALRNASARRVDERQRRRAPSGTDRDRRQRRQQTVPGRRAVGGAERGRDRIGQRRAGAGDAVVEAQHPDPAAGKHVVQRGIVDRIGRRLRRRPQSVPALDAFEVRVEPLRRRQPSARRLGEAERAVQEAARPARVDDEARRDAHGAAVALAFERSCRRPRGEAARAASRRGRRRPRPAPPARARDRSPAGTSACRRSRRAGSPRPAAAAACSASSANGSPGWWKKNVKPRFRPQATSGRARCHVPHFENGANPRQVVAVRQLLEQQVGERRRRLADGEARMAAAFDQHDAPAAPAQRERGERAGEAGADDGDVGVDAGDAARASCGARRSHSGTGDRRQHALLEVHRVEAIAARARSSAGSRANRSRSQRSTKTRRGRARASAPARSCARCRRGRARGTSRPRPAPRSRRCRAASAPATRRPRRRRRPRRPSAAATRPARVRHERRRDEQEHPQRHAAIGERAGGLREPLERDALVQPIERVGVRGLQAHRDLELRRRRRRRRDGDRAPRATDRRARRRARDATRRSPATARRAPRPRRRSRPRAPRADRRSCRRCRASCR